MHGLLAFAAGIVRARARPRGSSASWSHRKALPASSYVDPPAHAVVLSVDEKSQIQALDRTQPGLPLKKGRCGHCQLEAIRNEFWQLSCAAAAQSARLRVHSGAFTKDNCVSEGVRGSS
jgi:hypothetical protein